MELGEIEAALGRHDGVRQCAVILDRSVRDAGLVAFYVPDGAEVSREDLTDWLSGILPREMVPGRYVGLTELPLTGNGKIDHAALVRTRLEIGAGS